MSEPETARPVIDGVEITGYDDALRRLRERFPERSRSEIEAVLAREHEAFTGGRPLAIPAAVEEGAAEMLEASRPAAVA